MQLPGKLQIALYSAFQPSFSVHFALAVFFVRTSARISSCINSGSFPAVLAAARNSGDPSLLLDKNMPKDEFPQCKAPGSHLISIPRVTNGTVTESFALAVQKAWDKNSQGITPEYHCQRTETSFWSSWHLTFSLIKPDNPM